MTTFSDATILRHAQEVVLSTLEGDAVLAHPKKDAHFGLDEVGAEVWGWIAEHGTLGAVLDRIVAAYEVSRQQAQQDLMRLIDALLENGLVQVSEAAADS